MRRRRKRRNKNNGAPGWMVTYSDMVTLILVFFVLLFSMSQIDLVKFEAVSESFRNRMIFDFFPSAVPLEYPTDRTSHMLSGKKVNEFKSPTNLPDRTIHDEDSLEELLGHIEDYLEENHLTHVITANRTEEGIVLVLQDYILFETGQADILESGKPFLEQVGSLLQEIPNHVEIEGHTDSRPINSYRYPSNWELSGARAGSVIRYLLNEFDLDSSRFSLSGYGDTRPVKPNDTDKNMQKNRRVEIIILNEVTDVKEGDE